jgi:hypothetical protein
MSSSVSLSTAGFISAASAVNANAAFWFCTYEGALNAELFVELLRKMMHYRKKPVHLVWDSLPAHKKALVRDYVTSIKANWRCTSSQATPQI